MSKHLDALFERIEASPLRLLWCAIGLGIAGIAVLKVGEILGLYSHALLSMRLGQYPAWLLGEEAARGFRLVVASVCLAAIVGTGLLWERVKHHNPLLLALWLLALFHIHIAMALEGPFYLALWHAGHAVIIFMLWRVATTEKNYRLPWLVPLGYVLLIFFAVTRQSVYNADTQNGYYIGGSAGVAFVLMFEGTMAWLVYRCLLVWNRPFLGVATYVAAIAADEWIVAIIEARPARHLLAMVVFCGALLAIGFRLLKDNQKPGLKDILGSGVKDRPTEARLSRPGELEAKRIIRER